MRHLYECDVHGQFMFDIERLEAQIYADDQGCYFIGGCPRCFIARIGKLVKADPPKPKFVCWYPQGERL